ncbi:DUF2690 domain-containing protein [Streptomyces physcomitrii]|uniref:DUF2690 domain-containing protein n=1 Tax=Streptomyces physcomitrii TaxID=2724184 RepID=UPI003422CA26
MSSEPDPTPTPPPGWFSRLRSGAARRIGRGWRFAWHPASHATATLSILTVVLGSFTTALATGLWGEIFPPDSPPAAQPCPGKGCEGKSPKETGGCTADAVTYQREENNPATLHFRYSRRCGAVWARITTGEVGDEVNVSSADGAQSAVVESDHDQFTPMVVVGKTFEVRACAVPTLAQSRKGTWKKYCFTATDEAPWS